MASWEQLFYLDMLVDLFSQSCWAEVLIEWEVILETGFLELSELSGPAGGSWISVCTDGEFNTTSAGLLKALESVRDRLL